MDDQPPPYATGSELLRDRQVAHDAEALVPLIRCGIGVGLVRAIRCSGIVPAVAVKKSPGAQNDPGHPVEEQN